LHFGAAWNFIVLPPGERGPDGTDLGEESGIMGLLVLVGVGEGEEIDIGVEGLIRVKLGLELLGLMAIGAETSTVGLLKWESE